MVGQEHAGAMAWPGRATPHHRRRRIVVTGVGGFIGSHVAEALLVRGDEVVGIEGFVGYYPASLKRQHLQGLLADPGFTLVELDLRSDDPRPALEGADVVVHEAALAGLPTSWSEAAAYVECNVTGLARLIEACRDAGISRFVHASTSSVYGARAVGPEDQPTRPVSPYGVSKLAAEHLLLAHVHVNDFPATILRYFSIYGPRQRPDMAYHIFIEAMRTGRPITVFGDGRQSRSNTFVTDCVRGTVAAIDGGEVGEVYNIGGGVPLELRDAISLIADTLGVKPRTVYAPARPGDQRVTLADWSKAHDAFGFTPSVSPSEGVAKQVRWHLDVLGRAA